MKNISAIWTMTFVVWMLAACDASTEVVSTPAAEQKKVVEVVMYKSPGCSCCGGWAEHLRREGFHVIEKKREDMDAVKSAYGVSERLASCHTASVEGYVIEGHVPAADIRRLLKERPANVIGLTAPGMPMKSPGMQAEGLPPKGYDVLAFDKDGRVRVFQRY